jgi:predicted NACHT family NTPase/glycosyltransferase involved in cell wall biosynthesis
MSTCIVFVATAWGARYGGINSFNHDLCVALAQLKRTELTIVCVAHEVNEDDIEKARKSDVILIPESRLEVLSDEGLRPEWVIGHDVHTGESAINLSKRLKAQLALFHHMDYESYKYLQVADDEVHIVKQREILQQAQIVFAIGPKLRDSAEDIVDEGVTVIEILPGLTPYLKTKPQLPHKFSAITLGRLERGTDLIKQTSLAVASFAQAVSTPGKQLGRDPGLTVIGFRGNDEEDQDSLSSISRSYTNRHIAWHFWKYREERETLFDHLSRKSVCMMLSVHEGFGLVGLEAIDAEIPLVLADNTGLYLAVENALEGPGTGCLRVIEIYASSPGQTYSEENVKQVADLIFQIANNKDKAKNDAKELKKMLIEKGWTWEKAAYDVLEGLGLSEEQIGTTPSSSLLQSQSQSIPKHTQSPIESKNLRWQRLDVHKAQTVAELPSQLFEVDVKPELILQAQELKEISVNLDEIREHCYQKIVNQHSKMHLLSGEEIDVVQLYVDVWLLNRSPKTFQVSQSKLLETFDLRNDRLGLGDRIRRDPGFEIANANSKLLILGKPGSGKTTFLKHLAVDWGNRKFQPNLIAILIEFRRIQFEEWHLLDAIDRELGFGNWEEAEEASKEITGLQEESQGQDRETKKIIDRDIQVLRKRIEELRQQVKMILKQGKLLVLMDGLDEVPTIELRQKIQEQVRQMVESYPSNRFILTCRTQILKSIPIGFISVEVADFNDEQIKQFFYHWFQSNGSSNLIVKKQWRIFEKIINKKPALKELTATPVLLSLMCLVLQDEGTIPSQIEWLYHKGIRLLLSKWNDTKEISEWEVGTEAYRNLNVDEKENLLTEIAVRKFENSENFLLFDQKSLVAEITRFLRLASPKEGIAVLKAIEAQHGLLIERADELWSFSHLTFQEYFTVQWLISLPSSDLESKIVNSQWQGIVKQLLKSQQPADQLVRLIKLAIDRSIASEKNLQKFLVQIFQKAKSIQTCFKPASVRAFYFALGFSCTLDFAYTLDHSLTNTSADTFTLDHDFDHLLALADNLSLIFDPTYIMVHDFNHILAQLHSVIKTPELLDKLIELRSTLPNYSSENWDNFRGWWRMHGMPWTDQLRQVIIEHCNIGHKWQFTDAEERCLYRYYASNKFLVDLLNIPGAVSDSVYKEIEDTLLLPWQELQHHNPKLYN